MKPFEPFRTSRPSPLVGRVHAITATLIIVAVSAGLHVLGQAGLVGQGMLIWAAIILIPLTTFLAIALEWKALHPPARDRLERSSAIDIVKLFEEDISEIVARNRVVNSNRTDHDRTP